MIFFPWVVFIGGCVWIFWQAKKAKDAHDRDVLVRDLVKRKTEAQEELVKILAPKQPQSAPHGLTGLGGQPQSGTQGNQFLN
jgi:hypothetical protein